MVTDYSSSTNFKVIFQGGAGTYPNWEGFLLSRSMLRIERLDLQQMSLVSIDYQPNPNQAVAYYTDPDGVLEIPLRDFIGANAGGNPPRLSIDVTMTELDGTPVDTFSKYIDIVPGISFNDALAPRSKDADQLAFSHDHKIVLPPNVILNPDTFAGGYSPGIIVESNYHIIDGDSIWDYSSGGIFTAISPSGVRNNQLQPAYNADVLRLTAGKNHDQVKTWKLEKTDDCTNLVVCRWTSQTGAVRQHFFPIASFLKGVDNTYSIVESGNGYDIRKDTFNAIRCRLNGLTAYGYWYYMDIIHASDLHAIVRPSFSTFSDEIASIETAAYCEANDMETPHGNGFYSLEFTIKLRHYDSH